MIKLVKKKFTPDDLLKMPDGDRYELIDGELMEKIMSFKSSYIAGEVYDALKSFVKPRGLGWVSPEGVTFQCFPEHPDRVRKADVSFIKLERLSEEQYDSEGHCTVVPDLVVEVVSPNDLAYDVNRKTEDWFKAGTPFIWVVYPATKSVHILRPDGSDIRLQAAGTLTNEELLPGFACPVAQIFQPATAQTES